jgi:hypothetical protein
VSDPSVFAKEKRMTLCSDVSFRQLDSRKDSLTFSAIKFGVPRPDQSSAQMYYAFLAVIDCYRMKVQSYEGMVCSTFPKKTLDNILDMYWYIKPSINDQHHDIGYINPFFSYKNTLWLTIP